MGSFNEKVGKGGRLTIRWSGLGIMVGLHVGVYGRQRASAADVEPPRRSAQSRWVETISK